MKKLFILFSLTLVIFASCAKKATDVNTLNMVFVPASEKSDANSFKSLMAIVTKLTKVKFNFIKVTDYNAAVEAMRSGRADIAWFGAATYVIAADLANAEAFAAGIPKGKKDAGYYTYFVVKKDSPYKQLKDVKGTVIALNNIGSTSGDYIPQVELLRAGLNLKNKKHFKNVMYAGSHDASLLAVVNGQAQVCATSSHNYYGRIKDGTIKADSIRILQKSRKIPPAPLAYSKKIPKDVRDKIKKAVLEAHKHGKISGWGGEMEKYVSVEDKDFDLMRDVKKIIESSKK
ncbi:phosphate/phosphite/phosphonate ABC transporter substrate-binding protein [Spirochaetota bacterium]